jgi:hypothetical protein
VNELMTATTPLLPRLLTTVGSEDQATPQAKKYRASTEAHHIHPGADEHNGGDAGRKSGACGDDIQYVDRVASRKVSFNLSKNEYRLYLPAPRPGKRRHPITAGAIQGIWLPSDTLPLSPGSEQLVAKSIQKSRLGAPLRPQLSICKCAKCADVEPDSRAAMDR